MLRVAFDTTYLKIGRGGVARYIICLLEALREESFPNLDLREISYPFDNQEFRQPQRMLKTFGREFLWQPVVAPRLLQKLGSTILHAPYTGCIRTPPGVRKIITVHDLAYLMTPERFRRWTRLRIPLELQSCREADHVICPSQATADDAMRHLEIPANRITVIHHGSHFTADSEERAPSRAIPSEYFLFVSSLESGKNLKLLNETYRTAENAGRPLPPLLIAGKRVEGVADEGAPPKNWIYLGRVSDEELVWLYRRAIALVYPSIFEGFGFPILEAMALGTAVVCSPVSCLPEVGGDVPFYAPLTTDGYLAAFRRVLENGGKREERISAGLDRAKQFNWKRCARETAAVYEAVGRQSARRPHK